MVFTENVVAYLIKQTIKSKKLNPRECKITIADSKKRKDMYVTIEFDWKTYWNMFHYGKLWFDKYVLTTRLKKLHFLKRNTVYKDE